jgi:dUTPase
MPHQHVGLLSGEEIKSEGLIIGGTDALFRASTYDLSIGDIVPGGKRSQPTTATGEYRLRPGGMVRVVAKESLKLSSVITGHALPRNTLCTRGVLAINIGIVDPGFEGPISSPLINFGDADYLLKPGEPFLRLSFHRCPKSSKADEAQAWNRDQYVEEARKQTLAYLGTHFLNLDETAKKASEGAFGKFRNALVIWAAVAAVGLALMTILVPLGASYTDHYLSDRVQWQAQMEKTLEDKVETRSDAQIKRLTDEVAKLQNELDKARESGHPVAVPRKGGQ